MDIPMPGSGYCERPPPAGTTGRRRGQGWVLLRGVDMRAHALPAVSALILASAFAGQAAGQSLLRDGGEGGLGAAASFLASTEAKGLIAEGTWTGWGTVDFVLGYSRFSFDPPGATTAALTSHQTGAQLSWLAVRQDAAMPLSLQVGAGYSLLSYTGDAIGPLDVDGHAPTAAAALARRIDFGRDLSVVPVVGFQYSRATITYEADEVEVGRVRTYARSWTGIVYLRSGGDTFIAPRVDLSDGAKAVYGLTAGFLFPHRP